MPTGKITSKGQVTIPKEVRLNLGLRPGDQVDFVPDGTGFQLKKRMTANAFSRYRGHLRQLVGHDPDEVVEEMRGE